MRTKRLFIVFVLVLSLIISFIPTASLAAGGVDYEGNDNLDFKIDPPISTKVYFDEDGKETDDETIYWIEFTVSEDGKYLSFIANNLTVDKLSVKGGDNYRLYLNEGSSGSGFRSPDNNGGQIPVISHYSFEITIDKPEEPLGEIDVTKIVKNDDDEILPNDETEFKFRLYKWVDGNWEEVDDESPFYITGNDTETIGGLPLGRYKVVEVDIPDGFTLDSENDLIIDLEEDELEQKTEFTNKKDEDTPPEIKGQISVTKYLYDDEEELITDDDTEFTFVLYKLVEDGWFELDSITIAANSSDSFTDLPPGEYKVTEEDIPIGYFLISNNNQEVTIETDDQIEYLDFDNQKDSWDGTIRIQKSIRGEENATLEGFEFELWRNGEKIRVSEATDEFGEVEFNELPAGIYEIREVNTEYVAEYLDDNPVTIGPHHDHENDDVWVVRVNNSMTPPPPPSLGRITVEKVVQTRFGNLLPNNNTRFYFELERRVEGDWIAEDDGFIDGNGTLEFDDLEDGEYRVREVNIDDDFDLFSDNNIVIEVEDGSTEETEFINRLVPPPDDDDDEPDDDDDDDDPEDEPEEEPEEEEDEDVLDEVIVIEEPTPEAQPAQPVPVIEEVLEVIEEPTPQAAPVAILPKTGAASPFAFSGLGSILLGLGLFLKKKD